MFDKKAYMKEYNKKHYHEKLQWQKQNPEKMQASRDRFRKRHPNYYKQQRCQHKEKIDAYNHKYNQENEHKRHAENITAKMPKNDVCELCGSIKSLLKHHPDYDEPTIYVTVCSSCHNHIHNGEAQK